MAHTPDGLKKPRAFQIHRATDRVTFLYLDRVRVEQDDNGTHAKFYRKGGLQTVYLPSAGLQCLLLGNGTSITQPATAALNRSGCAVTMVGSGGVRSYGSYLSPFADTKLLVQQAAIVSDESLRRDCAEQMYDRRFESVLGSSFRGKSIAQMRGMEGMRMRAIYQMHAQRKRLDHWHRDRGSEEPVNRALNSANVALYGLVNAVVQMLGLSPGLGVIHTGNRQSFVLDIADLYKADTTIPAAFSCHASDDPENEVLSILRKRFYLIRLIPRVVEDIHDFLGTSLDEPEWELDSVELWGDRGIVPSGLRHLHAPLLLD